ncbi:MAG: response regulator [Treponema sp.]|nr:response regulator [Treponema sp.]
MEKSVLFVGKDPGFLAKAMIKSLKEREYDVKISLPDPSFLSTYEGNFPPVFLVYIEGDIQGFESTLRYLQDVIVKGGGGQTLLIVGSKGELDFVNEIISPSCIGKIYTRPVDPKNIIDDLDGMLVSGRRLGQKILIVDDDPILLRTIKDWLSDKYSVFMASGGADAMDFLKKNAVDLVLLDYEMPGTSGLETFEMMKRIPSLARIPVIFLTSKDDKDTVTKVLGAHPEKYILKTMPQAMIVRTIDSFFMGK